MYSVICVSAEISIAFTVHTIRRRGCIIIAGNKCDVDDDILIVHPRDFYAINI